MTDHEATIATLRAERDDWRSSATEFKGLCDEWQARAAAAEASLAEVRKALEAAERETLKWKGYAEGCFHGADEFKQAIHNRWQAAEASLVEAKEAFSDLLAMIGRAQVDISIVDRARTALARLDTPEKK